MTAPDYQSLIDAPTWGFIEATNAAYPPDTASLTIADQRAIYDRMCRVFFQGYPPGVTARDEAVAGVPCRVYPGADPVVIYLHGGGYVVGGLHSHDDVCAEIRARTGLTVVAVDYRLSPEHLHPAAFDDALAVTRAVAAHGPVIMAGDSAGGNELGSSMLLEQVTSVTATFVDDGIPRWRPKQIWASSSTQSASAKAQAQAERAKALSQGQRVTAKVRGWQQRDGMLWSLNAMCPVTAPILGLQARELLIVDIQFGLDDDGGELATLTLAPKAGYDLPREVIPSQQASAWQGIGITQEQFDRDIPSHLKRPG